MVRGRRIHPHGGHDLDDGLVGDLRMAVLPVPKLGGDAEQLGKTMQRRPGVNGPNLPVARGSSADLDHLCTSDHVMQCLPPGVEQRQQAVDQREDQEEPDHLIGDVA